MLGIFAVLVVEKEPLSSRKTTSDTIPSFSAVIWLDLDNAPTRVQNPNPSVNFQIHNRETKGDSGCSSLLSFLFGRGPESDKLGSRSLVPYLTDLPYRAVVNITGTT